MKILCVGRNYVAHAKELGNEIPTEPVLFMKPGTSLFVEGSFQYPSFSEEIHYELELVLKICKTGKNILAASAHEFYNEIALGIDFTARDLQTELKKNGLPWEKAKSFDGSAFVSSFIPLESLHPSRNIHFELLKNGNLVQMGNSGDMLFSFDEIVSFASKYFTLEKGDLIFTGTPEGVGACYAHDVLCGKLENEKIFELIIE
ncbi:MAG: fumarylacetoacetate hydrolase family protein [Flavobacteriaceae bacterium]|nr:fumarylacetoacetate hydrolase family protein [Flavobacteriaceae bacterium]